MYIIMYAYMCVYICVQAASNGTKVIIVMATDQDDDINGEIFFTIINGKLC